MYKFKRTLSLLLALCMLLSVLPLSAFALTITEKPDNDTTEGQPFLPGTGGSWNFRIPGLVTLKDGTLIAASDARWNHSGDGAGLDTIVSVSKDNGANWTATFANYLGDNGNVYNNLSTCIIDPAIGTDGTTAYLIADLFPAGIALNTSRYSPIAKENGFDANGNLMLRALADDTVAIGADGYNTMAGVVERYTYYLDLTTLKLYACGADGAEDTLIEDYTVDAHFNITGTDPEGNAVNTNLFFADSPYQPYPTDFLYMTTSTDGLNWSAPKLLNLQEETEQTLLVGPGNGTYDSVNDRMVFTAYRHTGGASGTGYECACLIWMDKNGNWYRSEDATVTGWSSEATCVVLGDGTVRIFYRDGYSVLRYTDFIYDAERNNYYRDPDATEVVTKAVKKSGCQLSAIKYSKTIEGKEVILISCPADTGARADGYLYVFLLNDDNTMELAYGYDIVPGSNEYFAYSCISEMVGGDIALLYEGDNPDTEGGAEIIFATIDMDDVTVFNNDARLNFIDVELPVGKTWTLRDTTGSYSVPADSAHDATVATVTATGTTATVPAVTTMYSGTKVALADALYTLTETSGGVQLSHTLSDGTQVWIDAHAGASNGGFPSRAYATDLTLVAGTVSGTIQIKDAGGSLHLFKEKENPYWDQCSNPCGYKHDLLFFRPAQTGETESTVFAGFVQVTNVADLENGGQYLIAALADNSNYYVLTPALGGASKESNDHLAKFTGDAEISATTVTIEAMKVGTTQVQIGSNVYNIAVTEAPAVELTVKEKESISFELDGAYDAGDVTELDETYAKAELTVTGDVTVYAELRDSTNSGTRVELADCGYTFTTANEGTWYATTVANGTTYYVCPNGKGHVSNQTPALTLTFQDNGSVYIKDASHYLYVNRSSLAWDRVGTTGGFEAHISFYLYGEGEDASSPIPGYKLITANDQIDSGSKYLIAFYGADNQLYVMNPTTRTASAYNQMAAVVKQIDNAVTTVTITGVLEGETLMVLAGTKYSITVLDEHYDPISIPATENVYKGPALTITEKPANGTTQNQPFAKGTGGSDNFRIPGIVTLTDGTVIATTDARWNHTGDGAGLDTLVSVTKDNGANWTYTYANYMGDNGNTKNNLSTSIIDPAIGTNGTTAYLIADLFPAGIALNTSKYAPVAGSSGFDANGNLMLRDLAGDTVVINESGYNTMAAAREYNYYLDLETYDICTVNGTVCTGFTVDEYFNITYTDAAGTTHKTNIFYADSPFQPYPTDYLYLTTSTDGLNWSVPKLLNLKEDSEQTLLIGPGNGTYDATTERMVFTAYEYTSGHQRTSLIWEDADGNWHRTEDATVNFWSSEATVVALADGTLRVFYRDGYSILHYTDFVWSAEQNNYVRDPNATEVATPAAKRYNNQLTAIVHSQKIEGKDAILVACAANPDARADGHLYVFLVNADKTLELAYDYDIIPGSTEYYAYNCITELKDGTIGLVYENDDGGNGTGQIAYKILNMDDVTVRENDARLTFVDYSILTGESVTAADHSGDHTQADTSELDQDVATVEMTADTQIITNAQLGSTADYTGALIEISDCLYTFTKNDAGYWVINRGDVYLNTNNGTSAGYPHATTACTFNIVAGYEEGTFYIHSTADTNAKGDTNYLYFDRAARNWNRVNNLSGNTTWMTNCSMSLFQAAEGEGSGEIPGYDRVTSLDDVGDGEYLIGACANDGSWYVAYPSTVEGNRYGQSAKVAGSVTASTTNLTFRGVGAGYTEVKIGSTVYRLTVADYLTFDKTVAVGSTITIENAAEGELTVADETKVKAALADGVITVEGLYPGETTVTLGRTQYVVTVTGTVVQVDLEVGDQASYVVGSADMTQPNGTIASAAAGTGYGAQQGSAQSVFAGGYSALEACLYTFTDNGDGTWTVSATAADGTTVYLQPYASNNGYPNVATPVNVTLGNGTAANSVTLYGNSGYLHFYRNSNLYFDRVTSTSGFEAATSFHLYRPAAEGETSSTEIPGFVQVAGKDAVTAGKYLIVAQNNSNYYMLYPTLSTANRSAQVAKVVDNAPVVTITGAAEGTTSFRVGSTVYEITVEKKIYEVTTDDVNLGDTLEDSLGMQFVVEVDAQADWEEAYAKVIKSYANGNADLVLEIPFEDWDEKTINGKQYYTVMFTGFAAKEMTDEVQITLYNGQDEVISNVWRDSMRDYIMRALGNAETALERTLYVDMLNYGAAAQKYFGYNKTDLANSGLTDEQKSWATPTVTDAVDERVKGTGYAGSTLALSGEIQLNFVFNKSTVTQAMYAVISFVNHNGETVEYRVEGSAFTKYSSTRWRITATGLDAADGASLVTCTVYKADGTKVTSAADSIESYAARDNGKTELYTMVLKYTRSAYAYAHPTVQE